MEDTVKTFVVYEQSAQDSVQSQKKGELPSWNLSDLFGSPDKAFEQLPVLESKVHEFAKQYKSKVQQLSASDLEKAVKSYESIYDALLKVSAYSYLVFSADRSNKDIAVFYQTTSERMSKIFADFMFFTLEISNFPKEHTEKLFLSNAYLKSVKQWFYDLQLLKPHQFSEEMERYAQEKSVTSSKAWVDLYDLICSKLQISVNGKEVSLTETLGMMSDKDEDIRKYAAKGLSEALSHNVHLFTNIINAISYDLKLDSSWRKFARLDGERHLSNKISADVVDALSKSVQDSYKSLSHKYYALKAKLMKKDVLNYWDRNAPYFEFEQTYTWEEAKDIVLSAYRSFSPEMADIAQQFFDNGWIDADLRPAKDSGAFAHPVSATAHPYVLLNFQGKARCVMTLAHELGHGIHQILARKQGTLLFETPLTLAETASIFGEMLVFQSLLQKASDKTEKLALLSHKIEDALNTIVRQIAFYEFEKELHEARKKGTLSTDQISEIWMKQQTNSLGAAVHLDDSYKVFWAYISHFYHAPFYVYSYAFGNCLVNSLYTYFKNHPEGFQKKYIDLLSAGGSLSYEDALAPFGLNMTSPSFWKDGLVLLENLLKQFEELVAE